MNKKIIFIGIFIQLVIGGVIYCVVKQFMFNLFNMYITIKDCNLIGLLCSSSYYLGVIGNIASTNLIKRYK